MNTLIRFTLLISLTASVSVSCFAAETAEKIKALIVDGQNNHYVWPKSTVMMKQYLEETGLFEVDVYRYKPLWRIKGHDEYLEMFNTKAQFIVDNPTLDKDFAPVFTDYDVVIGNMGYNATPWPSETQSAFEQYMQNGGGFVSVHAANNAFPHWVEYNKMVGVSGWGGRTEQHGPHVYFDNEGNEIRDFSKGDAGAHGNKHEFTLTAQQAHPIIEGMPTKWRHTKDECYGKLRGPANNLTVLATALCPTSEKGTGLHEPMLMVVRYGNGRIFHSTLGHDDYSFESVGFISTFQRGTEWAATKQVTIAVPVDFPNETQSSARSFSLK